MTLKEWREYHGWSQNELAVILGIYVSSVWRYEKGLRRPRRKLLDKIRTVSDGAVTEWDE